MLGFLERGITLVLLNLSFIQLAVHQIYMELTSDSRILQGHAVS
jgi:hypothetical protein